MEIPTISTPTKFLLRKVPPFHQRLSKEKKSVSTVAIDLKLQEAAKKKKIRRSFLPSRSLKKRADSTVGNEMEG